MDQYGAVLLCCVFYLYRLCNMHMGVLFRIIHYIWQKLLFKVPQVVELANIFWTLTSLTSVFYI